MTIRSPITFGEAAWLIAPCLLFPAMFIPIPGLNAEYLAEVAHGRGSALLSALAVTAGALAIVWGIGTGRMVLRRHRLRTRSL